LERETPFFGTRVRPALVVTCLLSFAFVRMQSRNEVLRPQGFQKPRHTPYV